MTTVSAMPPTPTLPSQSVAVEDRAANQALCQIVSQCHASHGRKHRQSTTPCVTLSQQGEARHVEDRHCRRAKTLPDEGEQVGKRRYRAAALFARVSVHAIADDADDQSP